MGVYIYQNNSELAMQNAYIGEYIGEYIIQTYNINNTPTSGSNYQMQYTNIAKSGYKITKVVIETDAYCPSSGSYSACIGVSTTNTNSWQSNTFRHYLRLGVSNIEYYSESCNTSINTEEFSDKNDGYITTYGQSNHLKSTWNADGTVNVVYGGHTHNYTFSSSGVSAIQTIFQQSTLYFKAGAYTSSQLANNKITVTYEPN